MVVCDVMKCNAAKGVWVAGCQHEFEAEPGEREVENQGDWTRVWELESRVSVGAFLGSWWYCDGPRRRY